MNKLEMKSKDLVNDNIEKISKLFPNVIVESEKGKSIDFDLLKQELSKEIVEGNKEKYQLTWPGKKQAIITANEPTNKTLRPVKEKSVDFDNTQNIYIEGDNLEVLKILQESYLNKVKCIYIDPPYNTGNDFIYNDKYINKNELEESGQIDKYNNRLISNTESNGKFHSVWLSMMYSRLKLSRNLLSEDGIIFISIDDNEQENLKKLCDEIFGEKNFVAQFIWTKTMTPPSLSTKCRKTVEYVLAYEKKDNAFKLFGSKLENGDVPLINTGNPPKVLEFPENSIIFTCIENGIIPNGTYDKTKVLNDIIIKNGKNINKCKLYGGFKWTQDTLNEEINKKTFFLIKSKKMSIRFQRKESNFSYKTPNNYLNVELNKSEGVLTNEAAVKELSDLELDNVFNFPKPVSLIKKIIEMITKFDKNAIIMDFFSGSATTAHATVKLNSEDEGNRKFILVQLPEKCNDKFKTICDFGEERIRRATMKIKEQTNVDIDYGFRVYKLDSSNMKDIYYKPSDLKQSQLNLFESNIKEDRTAEDLLTQVILDLGLTLDLKIKEENILENKVYFVDKNSLVACFDNKINIEILNRICEIKPLNIVFQEKSFKEDSEKINIYEKIKKLSPETEVSII